MFAVIDCGTSTSRVHIVNEQRKILASGYKSVGVRDTSITGSRETLRKGLADLFECTLAENNIPREDVRFAVASGMITSEIGLIELPHITAPAGIQELAESMVYIDDESILPIGCPIRFIRGIKTEFSNFPGLNELGQIDFMRGEEVQCIGAMELYELSYPCNIVALSSHTKIIYLNEKKQIVTSRTTMSGQLYNAICHSTSIGSSLSERPNEPDRRNSDEEIIQAAIDCVRTEGFVRTCLMPRFLQVFMQTNSYERKLFLDAAIAADDIKAFRELRKQGYDSNLYFLYGHEIRCHLYEKILRKEFGPGIRCIKVYHKDEIEQLTVTGSSAVAIWATNKQNTERKKG